MFRWVNKKIIYNQFKPEIEHLITTAYRGYISKVKNFMILPMININFLDKAKVAYNCHLIKR
jgi:hypothetical protein